MIGQLNLVAEAHDPSKRSDQCKRSSQKSFKVEHPTIFPSSDWMEKWSDHCGTIASDELYFTGDEEVQLLHHLSPNVSFTGKAAQENVTGMRCLICSAPCDRIKSFVSLVTRS